MVQVKVNGLWVNFEILHCNSYGDVLHFYDIVEFYHKEDELVRYLDLKFSQGCTLEELNNYIQSYDYVIAKNINIELTENLYESLFG